MSDRLEGARIVHVEALTEPLKWVLVFEHRGTDDDSGYLVVDGSDIHFNDGSDPDAWRELSLASHSAEYSEGDRCEVCGYWWWADGKWHSLIPKLLVDLPEEARWTRCPDHHGERPTPARDRVANGQA